MQPSSPAVEPRRRSRAKKQVKTGVTPDEWIDRVTRDERRAVRMIGQGRNPGQGLLEYYDAANEDSEGRLPHEAGYEGRWAREARVAREAGVPEPEMTRVMALLLEDADQDFEQLVLQYAVAA